jgi:hypothetical protein
MYFAHMVLVAMAAVAAVHAQTACSSFIQCPLAQPVCQQYTLSFYACAACSPTAWRMAGGGSCYCDASQAYCSNAQATLASCRLTTLTNNPCTVDSDCITYATNTMHSNAPDQVMYCIGNKCKPCNPATWSKYDIGGPSRRYTCPGYDPVLSNQYNRYMTGSPMPGFTFTCTQAGDILVLNSTINFNYGYPGGDRSTWTPTSAVVATTAGGATTATAGTATTGAAGSTSGTGSTSTTTGGKTKTHANGGKSGAASMCAGIAATAITVVVSLGALAENGIITLDGLVACAVYGASAGMLVNYVASL